MKYIVTSSAHLRRDFIKHPKIPSKLCDRYISANRVARFAARGERRVAIGRRRRGVACFLCACVNFAEVTS